jgi:glycosyltransferase involved in cell wall biosynthesis
MNSPASTAQADITIIVKALNEERHIEACLRSAQTALAGMHGLIGEVVLADSLSTDRTVEIAAAMGVRIVQFERIADRGCGAALQLGYQFATGRYIYVLDGDMQLVPEFLRAAYEYLQHHPDVAGVGGRLIDTATRNEADRKRNEYYETLRSEQVVSALGGGGLYRRTAIDQVGYLSNRWLPAFEEAELAVRLQAAGYHLIRLSEAAVYHSGHAETSAQMFQRLWRSRRIDASGMFLRGALGRPWFGATLKTCWFVFAAPAVYGLGALLGLVIVLLGLPVPLVLAAPLVTWGGVFAMLAWRKRSINLAMLSIVVWHVYLIGGLRGFLRTKPDPMQPILAKELCNKVET